MCTQIIIHDLPTNWGSILTLPALWFSQSCDPHSTQRRTRHLLRPSLNSRMCAEDTQVRPCVLNENCFQFQYNLTGTAKPHSNAIFHESGLMGECMCVCFHSWDSGLTRMWECIACKVENLTLPVFLHRKKCPCLARSFSKATWNLRIPRCFKRFGKVSQ